MLNISSIYIIYSQLTPQDSKKAGFVEYSTLTELEGSAAFKVIAMKPKSTEALSAEKIVAALRLHVSKWKGDEKIKAQVLKVCAIHNWLICLISQSFESVNFENTENDIQQMDANIAMSLHLAHNKLKESESPRMRENPFEIVSVDKDIDENDQTKFTIRPVYVTEDNTMIQNKYVTEDDLDIYRAIEAVLRLRGWNEYTNSEQLVQMNVGSRLIPSFRLKGCIPFGCVLLTCGPSLLCS